MLCETHHLCAEEHGGDVPEALSMYKAVLLDWPANASEYTNVRLLVGSPASP